MSKQRIPKELLPAATTIYTPDWAIKYMVENSLGRLWLEGHPNGALKAGWSYYLEEARQEPEVQAQFAKIREEYAGLNPEDIRFIDPCMGSGHILVYAFDVLMQIYEAQGYTQRDAARCIVEKNLYGLDIDRRAYQLAYFAVMMKARQYNRRILNGGVRPNLYAICGSAIMTGGVLDFIADGDQKLRAGLQSIADDLADAEEYGSIIHVSPVDFDALLARFEQIRDGDSDNLFEAANRQLALNAVLPLVKQAQAMAQKYDVICTNPPYLGSARFSEKLNSYVVANYPDVKADLSMVMYKHALCDLCRKNGFVSFITTTSWMFLSSFEKLRSFVLSGYDFESLVDFGTELFDGKVGHNPIVAWVNRKSHTDYAMTGIRLVDYCYSRRDEKEPEFFNKRNYHYPKQSNFSKIPGSPIAYWVSERFVQMFSFNNMGYYSTIQEGLKTGDNDHFTRLWQEIDFTKSNICGNDTPKWVHHTKGRSFRKWYGNQMDVLNYENDGAELKEFQGASLTGRHNYFKECITYMRISSEKTSFRFTNSGSIPNLSGLAIYPNDNKYYLLGWLNSKIVTEILRVTNPTISFPPGTIAKIPARIDDEIKEDVEELVKQNIRYSKADWDSYETSWDFKRYPLV